MKTKYLLTCCAAALISVSNIMAQKIQYPVTKKVSQTDDYFGTKIEDPYRWLEDDTSAETSGWVQAQNAVTQDYLSKLPGRAALKQRLTELWNYPKYSAPFKSGRYFTYTKNEGLQNQGVVYVTENVDEPGRVLLDPNKLSADGTVALQAMAFSKNQKYLAYAVSASGSDWQEVNIMDMKTGSLLNEKLSYIKFTGISWKGDEGFYYSGYTKPADEKTMYSAKTEFQKVFYHKIGTPQSEDVIIYKDDVNPLRYKRAQLTEDGRFLVLNISEGTDGVEIRVKDMKSNTGNDFTTIVPGFKTNADVIENVGDKILLETNYKAPNRRIVLLDPKNPAPENWKTIVPESRQAIVNTATGGGKLFVTYLQDAQTVVKQYSFEGMQEHLIKLPGIGAATGFASKKEDKTLYYSFTSFTHPTTIYKYDVRTGESKLFRASDAKFNPDDFETKQLFVSSKDGSRVPVFVTYKKGLKLNGSNPTILYAYGGFNVNVTPAFSVSTIPFLENGGVYAVANLRGGGEYGEEWHRSGMLSKKQNVFDDFIAVAEHLITNKYTSSKHLAVRGGSNGGLLVGAVMTQRPDLFAVAIPQVGVLDMLRYHKFTVGWGWVPEYGSSDKKEDFEYLIKYSPLHNLKPGTCYPATLITTADHDDRVVPAHSFKFASTLQAAQSCDDPVLIRIDSKAGHGAGKPTSKQIDEIADILAFTLFHTR